MKCRSSMWITVVTMLVGVAAQAAQAQTFTPLHTFAGAPDGASPEGALVLDAAGNLYGTTSAGGNGCGFQGKSTCGTVFKIDATGAETVLYRFTGGTDGSNPRAGVVLDAAGNLYGTTSGAATLEPGTIFKLDTAGTVTVLHTGFGSLAGLVLDAAGNLYGTTGDGGVTTGVCAPNGCGTVFKLDTLGTYTVLYSFTGQPDGNNPEAGLVLDTAGNLYGTTKTGGASDLGTVFKVDTSNTETVLYSFTGPPDGENPSTGLVLDAAGNLYGTTYSGGLLDCFAPAGGEPPSNKPIYCGVVFKVDTTGTETVLHSFTGIPDGALPQASLVLDAAGDLFGTTVEGGSNGFFGCEILNPVQATGCGSIFKLDPSGTLSVLYSFSGNLDFGYPTAGLALDPAGNLYGTVLDEVFKLDALGAQNFDLTVLPSGQGSGTLAVNGTACPGSACSEFFSKGTAVTVTATASAGSSFAGWSAPCSSSGTGACNLNVNAAQLIFATFNLGAPDFSVSATALTPAAVSPGGSSTATLNVVPVDGFSGSVAFTCAVTPAPALAPTCSISPSSIAPGTPATLTVSTTAASAAVMIPGVGLPGVGSGLFYALCLPLVGWAATIAGFGSKQKGRKKLRAGALIWMLLSGLVFQIACGSSSSPRGGGSKGTPAGAYTITVTGTYSTGSLVHTTPTMLTVQ